jgi:hypothetical protein
MMKRMLFALSLAVLSETSVAEGRSFVLPANEGAPLLAQCSRSAPNNVEAYWIVQQSQIKELEKRLELFLRSSKVGSSALPIKRFSRQYVGFVKGGKRYIYGNFYRAESISQGEDNAPAVVCDGGKSFWGIVFSIESKTFQDLKFNGPA